MINETQERPAEPDAPVDPPKWVMPKPCRGQSVVFYYRGTISERNADVAFVSSIGERQIGVNYRGSGYEEVYHRDDPRLKANPSLRQDIDGVWDFTEESKTIEARLAALESAVKTRKGPSGK